MLAVWYGLVGWLRSHLSFPPRNERFDNRGMYLNSSIFKRQQTPCEWARCGEMPRGEPQVIEPPLHRVVDSLRRSTRPRPGRPKVLAATPRATQDSSPDRPR